jgi:RND family efflux transporter MFP subunit
MKHFMNSPIYTLLLIPFAVSLLLGCSATEGDVEEKKKELDEARSELVELKAKISDLEKEIAAADPDFSKNNNAILVATARLERGLFEHYIENRGAVRFRKNVTLSAQGGGVIDRVWVVEGQQVSKGQTLVTLDADMVRESIEEIKTQLDLATQTFEKQTRLWEQKIGTELQYLQAKTQKESLERRLASAYAQLDQMVVKAPFSGTIDMVEAREGELASPGLPLVRMVSPEDVYINCDVSEDYIGRFKSGETAEVELPSSNIKLKSVISSVGQVINPENRTFVVEVKISNGSMVKPNQVAIVKLRDYVNPDVFSVPTKVVQTDNKGKYIFVVEKKGDQPHARKVYVQPGKSYNSLTEITEGLTGEEVIIRVGYRDVTDGAVISLSDAREATRDVATK